MSILIACKKGDTVYLGTDTRVIVNDYKTHELCESNLKIQKLENDMLLGITGETIERQTLIAYSEIFTLDKRGSLTKKHIVKAIIPRLLSVLKQEDLLVKPEGDFPYMRAMIVLAYKDTLYEICADFSVIRYEDFQVLGRCSDYAQAFISNVKEGESVNEKIIKALDFVAKNTQCVARPYILIDTKELKYKLIRGQD